MKPTVTLGIVLNRIDYGEADRILTILTPDYGRIRAVAKGVRKINSKLAGGIELFSISYITFIKGKGDLFTLISTRLKKHYGHIVEDLSRTMLGYDILKLVNKQVEDNAGGEYFATLAATLAGLDSVQLPAAAAELWLYAQLLKLAGRMPQLAHDAQGQPLRPDMAYTFDIDKMAFAPRSNGHYTPNDIKLLRLVFHVETPLKLLQLKDIQSVLLSSLTLLKTLISDFTK